MKTASIYLSLTTRPMAMSDTRTISVVAIAIIFEHHAQYGRSPSTSTIIPASSGYMLN